MKILININVSVHALPKIIVFAIRGTEAIFWETLELCFKRYSLVEAEFNHYVSPFAQPLLTDKLAPW